MDAPAEYAWTPPVFDVSRAPALTHTWAVASPSYSGNFPRSARWSPDGAVALVHCEDRAFRLYTPPADESAPAPPRTLAQPAPILSYAWYPFAAAASPATFCFAAAVRETPVKLLDAGDGRLRASYPIVDHRERQIAPHSLAFNLSATRLYCGFEDAIEVFDVARPAAGTRVHTTPSKKSRDGMKGIISALAFSPAYGSELYAAGSLASTSSSADDSYNIALYNEADGAVPVLFVGGSPGGGVTQLQFDPARPHVLYAAFRRMGAVYSWDLRAGGAPVRVYEPAPSESRAPTPSSSLGTTAVDPAVGSLAPKPAAESQRKGRRGEERPTNQKRQFDVDVGGRWLGVGDQQGRISVFGLSEADADFGTEGEVEIVDLGEKEAEFVPPRLVFDAHGDAIGGVAFHPAKAALLSVSGSRHFWVEDDEESSEEEDDDVVIVDAAGKSIVDAGNVRRAVRPMPVPLDASVRLWDFGEGRS
ncbi:hypothetical protein B0H10DRAFT_2091731 [Mycena sp. CBHHK59/15]|nr:hypothetical protein B0H10DRAFT_2091731 [Mycena sp. CBHHK59/15]